MQITSIVSLKDALQMNEGVKCAFVLQPSFFCLFSEEKWRKITIITFGLSTPFQRLAPIVRIKSLGAGLFVGAGGVHSASGAF